MARAGRSREGGSSSPHIHASLHGCGRFPDRRLIHTSPRRKQYREITSRLSSVKRLAVISPSSATQYDRRGKTLRQLGGDLGVDYVLEGTVRWARGSQGSQVRISPQLVRVSDDTNVWSHRYDATLDDVFKVQSDIAHQAIASLQVALEANERRSLDAHRTGDNEAYLAYLRGLTAFQRGSSDTSNQAVARSALERAVERDPGFSLAWAWLSRVYASQYALARIGRRKRWSSRGGPRARPSTSIRHCPRRTWRRRTFTRSVGITPPGSARWRSRAQACRVPASFLC